MFSGLYNSNFPTDLLIMFTPPPSLPISPHPSPIKPFCA